MQIEQMHDNFDLLLNRKSSNDRPDFPPWEKDELLNLAILQFVKTRYNLDKSVFGDKMQLYNSLGFESNQRRIDELKTLHIKSPELQPSLIPINIGNGIYEFRLNALGNNISGQFFRYMFLTKMFIKAVKNNCRKNIEVRNWQIDDTKTSFTASSWKWNRALANFGKSTDIIPSLVLTNQNSPDFHINLRTGTNSTERYNNDRLGSIYIDTKNKDGIPEFEIETGDISYLKFPNRVTLGVTNNIDNMNPAVLTPIHCDIDDAFHDEIIRIAVSMAMDTIQDQTGIQISSKNTGADFIS